MASGQLSRDEALECSRSRHACHVMLYSDTASQLFGRIPIRHIVLMQMRFDGLLGFPGGELTPKARLTLTILAQFPQIRFYDGDKPDATLIHHGNLCSGMSLLYGRLTETLEEGLTRELLEELGVAVPVSIEDYVKACFDPRPSAASRSSRLILHFYVKKMEEEQIREIEKAAASTAADHGLEVLGMVRVPLYTTKSGGGLPFFLSHSFIGNARSQLVDSLLRLHLVSPRDLQTALRGSQKIQAQGAQDLLSALELTAQQRKQL